MLQELKNYETMPPIYFKPDSTIDNNPEDNQDYLKVDITTQPGYINRKKSSLYILIFKTSFS